MRSSRRLREPLALAALVLVGQAAAVSAPVAAPCDDDNNGCDDWAANGECSKNKQFMSVSCRAACGFCRPELDADVASDDPLLGRERLVMTTEHGELVLGFYPSVAPVTVAHIIKLVQLGGYNTNHIFRVDKGFVAQVQAVSTGRRARFRAGSLLKAEAARTMPDEFSEIRHVRGILSMGKFDAPHTGTSSFSIMLGSSTALDRRYTVFGKLLAGDHVLTALEGLPTKREGIFVMPRERIEILSAVILYAHPTNGTLMVKPMPALEPRPERGPEARATVGRPRASAAEVVEAAREVEAREAGAGEPRAATRAAAERPHGDPGPRATSERALVKALCPAQDSLPWWASALLGGALTAVGMHLAQSSGPTRRAGADAFTKSV